MVNDVYDSVAHLESSVTASPDEIGLIVELESKLTLKSWYPLHVFTTSDSAIFSFFKNRLFKQQRIRSVQRTEYVRIANR
jgi:hypothetical protein